MLLALKVIPQKKKLLKYFLETFPECSLLIPVLRTTRKKISQPACLRDIVGRSYPLMPVLILNMFVISSAQDTFCGSLTRGFLQ